MTTASCDDLAKLAHSLAGNLPKKEAKEAVAGILGEDEDTAWALIERGKVLAKEAERVG